MSKTTEEIRSDLEDLDSRLETIADWLDGDDDHRTKVYDAYTSLESAIANAEAAQEEEQAEEESEDEEESDDEVETEDEDEEV